MLPRSKMNMGMPLGFKIWFGFVGFLALSIFAGTVYVLAQIVKAGPEGVGRQLGAFARAVKDGANQ